MTYASPAERHDLISGRLALPLRTHPALSGRRPAGGRLVAARHPPALVGIPPRHCRRGRLGAGHLRHEAGIPALAERLYAAAVTLAAGGWLAAATAACPVTSPLPHALVIGGTVLAVPWWAHRRRRARVRIERNLQAWPEIAKAVGLPGSQVMSGLVDVWGWRSRLRLARGQTITDVIGKIPALESALGTFRGAIRVFPTPDDLANRCELRVLEIDPHAGSITWPGPSVSSITEPIDLGPFEDAAPCRVLFLRLARPVRLQHRLRQERRPEPANGQPGRLPRRGRSGASTSSAAWNSAYGPPVWIAWPLRRSRPAPSWPTRWPLWKPAPRNWPLKGGAPGNHPRTPQRW